MQTATCHVHAAAAAALSFPRNGHHAHAIAVGPGDEQRLAGGVIVGIHVAGVGVLCLVAGAIRVDGEGVEGHGLGPALHGTGHVVVDGVGDVEAPQPGGLEDAHGRAEVGRVEDVARCGDVDLKMRGVSVSAVLERGKAGGRAGCARGNARRR